MLNFKKRQLRTKNNRRGATTVELATVLPVFLLVVFGCMEFSRISLMRSLASNACYEAARASMVTGGTTGQAEQVVDNVLGRLGVDGATTDVVFTDRNGQVTDFDNSQRVTVSVSIPYGENNPILPAHFTDVTFDSQVTLWTSRN